METYNYQDVELLTDETIVSIIASHREVSADYCNYKKISTEVLILELVQNLFYCEFFKNKKNKFIPFGAKSLALVQMLEHRLTTDQTKMLDCTTSLVQGDGYQLINIRTAIDCVTELGKTILANGGACTIYPEHILVYVKAMVVKMMVELDVSAYKCSAMETVNMMEELAEARMAGKLSKNS